MSRKRFNRHDIGCHADGAFGHDHVRMVMARTLSVAFGADSGTLTDEQQVLVNCLASEMPDDAWDEDEFFDVIAPACDGVHFALCDGDLVCFDDSEDTV